MGNFKFAMTLLVKEYKKSAFYALTMVFAIAVCFIFFNIMNNDLLADPGAVVGGATWNQVNVPLSTTLSFIIIYFCCFMIFFANSFFISRKTNEIAIMTLSGNSSFKSTKYLIYQTFVLLLIAAPIGLALGMAVTPISNYWMFHYLGIEASIYHIPSAAFMQTIVVVAMILVALCVFASGYIYRNDISSLLQQEKAMDFSDKRKLVIPSAVYLFLYVFGIVMMFMNEHSATAYIAPTGVGIVGAIGLIRYALPEYIKKFKEKKLLEKRYALIYVSNLGYSIQRAILLISLMMISVTGMIAAIAANQGAPREYITGVIGYIVIIILLITSIVYKFCMEAQTRKTLFFNLWKIGYTRKEITKIIKYEVFYFYLVLLLIPMIYIIIISGCFIYHGEMSVAFALGVIGVYFIPVVCSGLITYYNYKKAVVAPIHGGKNDGK